MRETKMCRDCGRPCRGDRGEAYHRKRYCPYRLPTGNAFLLLSKKEREAVHRTLDAWVRTDLSDPNLPALRRVLAKLDEIPDSTIRLRTVSPSGATHE